ncbi:hypothetical protein J437_LFUL007684 [Ladona fulva]|uniref:26S proteasome non-ATPase regulatory subunit 3 N-terminal TPR repeats domain-containing protein n=1 Tax=Ladona fulva TaxID=123851 RepID=A0A8K0NYD8_LADFU|nr:hypothetical protein J437_LFUL007684 [Ladona fulva]
MVAAAETVQDVEMKSADSPLADDGADKKETDMVTLEDIREHARQMDRAVQSKEPRFALRVLRLLPHTRRRLTQPTLRRIINAFYTPGNQRDVLLSFVDEPTEAEAQAVPPPVTQRPVSKRAGAAGGASSLQQAQPLPEVDAYLHLLVLVKLIDAHKYEEAVRCSDLLMSKVSSQNRRSIDLVAAKCYFYFSRAYELTNQLDKIRGFLHKRLQTATLRSDFEGQAVLINCLLRNYLHYNLYDQADKLVSKSVFPESASNNEWARFLYYLGRIKATQLEYSAAHKHLVQAARKAPQYTAVGFKQTVSVDTYLFMFMINLGFKYPTLHLFKSINTQLISYVDVTGSCFTMGLMKEEKFIVIILIFIWCGKANSLLYYHYKFHCIYELLGEFVPSAD